MKKRIYLSIIYFITLICIIIGVLGNVFNISPFTRMTMASSGKYIENSSILIVVGREDTGDLESQVRGSRYAWNIRIISTDALIQLLKLKETFNDAKTILQITELLKPREYTRVDKLIDLIFETSKDLQLDDIDTVETPSLSPTK